MHSRIKTIWLSSSCIRISRGSKSTSIWSFKTFSYSKRWTLTSIVWNNRHFLTRGWLKETLTIFFKIISLKQKTKIIMILNNLLILTKIGEIRRFNKFWNKTFSAGECRLKRIYCTLKTENLPDKLSMITREGAPVLITAIDLWLNTSWQLK